LQGVKEIAKRHGALLIFDEIITGFRFHMGGAQALFEVVSSTEWQPFGSGATFQPNLYIDISDTLDHKLRALSAYPSEIHPWPHARSIKAIENLARWRGSNVGVTAAESFILGREILRLSDDRDIH